MKARVITNAERKALMREVDLQTAKNVRGLSKNLLAVYLWHMHEHEGHGKKRLKRDAKNFGRLIKELEEFYDFKNGEDMEFLYKYKLKTECGIDVDTMDDVFDFKIVMEGDKK